MKVAIIGAGMAGLTCGTQLRAAGHGVQLFDKGRGPGGRMATRRIEHDGTRLSFDHGAQYFTARDPAFVAQVEAWERDGIVARWSAASKDAWVGTPAMNAPIRALAEALDVQFGARAERIERDGEGWRLRGEAIPPETYDAVAIAVPAEQVAPLVAGHAPEIAEAARAIDSAPCWSAMVAFATSLDAPDTIQDRGAIAWAARNSAKPGRIDAPECWVLQATPEWSRANLERDAHEVCADLLAAFAREPGSLPAILFATAHRWRYAMCEKNDLGALWDASLGLGACGDWLSGPRVENAFLSGAQLARRMGHG